MKEYAWLIQEIRENRKTLEIEDAVNKALADMPDDFVIKGFLEAHKMEVSCMLLTEYNEAEAMELFRRDGKKEGIKEGIKEGVEQNRVESIRNLMTTLKLNAQQAMDALLIPADDQMKYMAKI